ncbi:MAG: PEGA domain-containing protein [Candidatus Sumerlaeota bacterium]
MASTSETGRSPIIKAIATLLIPTMLMYSTSCSLLAPRSQSLSISSEPAGADVIVNGERIGMTPIQTKINRKDDASIMIRKDGYKSVTKETGRELSGVGIVDVIFGCLWLVPLLGLLGDGAYKQDPRNIAVILPPE